MKRPKWEIPEGKIETTCETHKFGYGRRQKCIKKYEIIDNDKLKLRRGDIIRIPKDRYELSRHYREQFAVVLDRFKITKNKPHGTFIDYGVVLMMISGDKKGNIFKAGSMRIPSYFKNLSS